MAFVDAAIVPGFEASGTIDSFQKEGVDDSIIRAMRGRNINPQVSSKRILGTAMP